VTPAGASAFFTTKVHYLPHLRMIVAVTGVFGFCDEWLRLLNTRVMATDVESVDAEASEQLRKLWNELIDLRYSIEDHSTTIYHFGIAEATEQVSSFAYRSAAGSVERPWRSF